MKLFGTPEPPSIDYTLDELYSKARDRIIESAAVPGVQPKMSLERLSRDGDNKLTFVGLWGAVDLIRDPYSDAQSGGLRLTALSTMDTTISRAVQSRVLTGIE